MHIYHSIPYTIFGFHFLPNYHSFFFRLNEWCSNLVFSSINYLNNQSGLMHIRYIIVLGWELYRSYCTILFLVHCKINVEVHHLHMPWPKNVILREDVQPQPLAKWSKWNMFFLTCLKHKQIKLLLLSYHSWFEKKKN